MTAKELRAAQEITRHWLGASKLTALEDDCRPQNDRDGSVIQAALGECLGDTTVGWKLAATASAGQRHLHVDGPMAGRLFASRVKSPGADIPMHGNQMLVAECEFVFVLGEDLPPRETPYTLDQVLAAVTALHPGLELPDSRFEDFTIVGAPQLIADNACAHYFVLGEATTEHWRELDLAAHPTRMLVNGETATSGTGADVLGDPRIALTWIANNHSVMGEGLKTGQMITTGVSGKPVPIRPGDHMCADLGILGQVCATLVA